MVYRMGIDPENGWKADYKILPGKEKVVEELKQLAKTAETVYLATDLDRVHVLEGGMPLLPVDLVLLEQEFDAARQALDRIAALGSTQVFQDIQLFSNRKPGANWSEMEMVFLILLSKTPILLMMK